MSTFIKNVVFLMLISCGYSPVYKYNEQLLKHKINIVIKIEQQYSKDKQIIKNHLSKRLLKKNATESSLKLVLAIQKNVYSLGLQKDLTNTRSAVNYNLNYVFYDKAGIVSQGSLNKSTSFNVGESPYANEVAEDKSSYNLLKALADELSLLIIALPSKRKIYP